MNDLVRQKLCRILATVGREVCGNSKRLRGLLADDCPGQKLEVNVLVTALEQGMVDALLNSSAALPWEAVSGRLVRRMKEELSLTENAARWAVETWGLALGKKLPGRKARDDEIPSALPADPNAPRTAAPLPNWLHDIAVVSPSPKSLPNRAVPPQRIPYSTTKSVNNGRSENQVSGGPDTRDSYHTRRPVWVYCVGIIYILLLSTVLFLPVCILALSAIISGDWWAFLATTITVGIILSLGGSLLLIPIGKHWDLPRLQKSIIIPLLGSATCAALLCTGAALAMHEFLFGTKSSTAADIVGYIFLVGIGIAWLVWIVVFGIVSRSLDRISLSDRMYKRLLAGSILELFVAIPTHLIVRRRAECCAGYNTGAGIGIGLVIMFVTLGPAVFFLFFRRYKQVYSIRKKKK